MVRRLLPLMACGLVLASVSPSTADISDTEGPAATSDWVNSTVTISTNFGAILAMLYDEGAPITTSNFINLSSSGFYDGIKFHRIIDDFVIQTGDPNSKDSNPYNDGTGGSSQTIPLEINDTLTHEDGAFGMARSNDPNSASSQFYICDGAQHQLDGNYAVFGIVVEGIDVVRTIASQPTWGYKRPLLKDHPIGDIVMESVVISPGYWNNSTAPGASGGGGIGAIFSGGGGAAAAFVVVLALAAVAAYFIPPVRARVAPRARRLLRVPVAVVRRVPRPWARKRLG